MLLLNRHPEKDRALDPTDVATYGPEGLAAIEAYLATRENDLRFLTHLLNASGLAAVLLLLLEKHGLVNVW